MLTIHRRHEILLQVDIDRRLVLDRRRMKDGNRLIFLEPECSNWRDSSQSEIEYCRNIKKFVKTFTSIDVNEIFVSQFLLANYDDDKLAPGIQVAAAFHKRGRLVIMKG